MVTKLINSLAIILVALWPSASFGAWPSSGKYAPTLSLNLVTDLGASCNGVADDGPALAAAGAAMRTFQAVNPLAPVTLYIPPGSNCTPNTCPVASDGKHAFQQLTNVTIIATGASINASGGGNCGNWGGGGPVNPWTADGFVANTIGDSCVTMTTPGTEVNYPVGRWVVIGGQGVQVNSFPPNYANFEYVQVSSLPSGQVCFATPLQNFYPTDARAGIDLTGQNCSNMYCGGPGKLSLMNVEWNGYFHVIGGHWVTFPSGGAGSSWWSYKTVIFDNVTWDGINPSGSNQCWYPTFVGTVTYNNSNFPRCNVEVDKEIDRIVLNNSSFGNLQFQSPSIHSLAVNNGSITPLEGTPPITTCDNSTINLGIGTTFGSNPTTFTGVNCTFDIRNIPFNGFTLDHVGWTYANGTFTASVGDLCSGIPQWFSTGGRLYGELINGGANDADNYFTVTGATVPVSPPNGIVGSCTQALSVTTTLPNVSDPPPAFVPGGTFVWLVDQARNMSCTGCIGLNGNKTAFDLNFPAAQGKPISTYFNRTYTCPNNLANVPGSYDLTGDPLASNNFDGVALRGNWVSFSANVITADTNPADAGLGNVVQFGVGQIFNPTTGATGTLNPVDNSINLNVAGIRTILPTSTTGAQTGDTLTSPSFGVSTWVAGGGGISVPVGSPTVLLRSAQSFN